jgi:methylmalonyl-CoA/ethylmalonyl-CoA epimerase
MATNVDNRPAALAQFPVDHIGIAVSDLDAASGPYDLPGLARVGEDEEIASQRVRVRALKAGDSLIELLEPTAPESPIAKFLEKRGAGLHHVALRVRDLRAEIVRLKALRAHFIDDEPRAGRARTQVVFLHPKWTGGVLVELVEHS